MEGKSASTVAASGTTVPTFNFRLPATDGKTYTLAEIAGPRGTVIAFICNHCPYVKAVVARMVADARVLMGEGIGFAAICSNDAQGYPEDSFSNMAKFAARHEFPFPYLHDEDQLVAKAFGAECTPEFFGLNAEGAQAYRGRLDGARMGEPDPGDARELVEAMRLVAETGKGPETQLASIGCSIKWRA